MAFDSNIKPSQPLFLPKIISSLKGYTRTLFFGDLAAGVSVGIVALPLVIAFAIASGVTPDRGLVAAILGGFVISAFGGSRVQIGGPTGAFVVIIYKVVGLYGVDGLMICTFMAGVILVLMGLLRLGTVIKFIPYPLTVGFTAGIAILIATSQVKDFFGLAVGPLPADFVEKWIVYFKTFDSIQPLTVGLSVASLAIILLWQRVSRKVPGPIVVIVLMTFIVQFFHLPVATIGSSFDSIFHKPAWFHLNFQVIKQLVSPAFTIAFLGAIQSLLSATVADGLIEGRHRSNTELMAQGLANMIVPLFGGIPATGAVARTLTNVRNGGRTPVAGIVHALFLLAVVLLFGKWVPKIPLCVLSAILLVVCYQMGEWHAFKSLLRGPRLDVVVLFATFLLTIFVDLTVAVEVGLLLSVVLFMKRMTDATSVREITSEMSNGGPDEEALRDDKDSVSRRVIPEGVVVYEAEGALFFGVAEMLRDTLDLGKKPPKVLILRMRHVLVLDATGLRALRDLKRQCMHHKARLILSGVHAQPLIAMERSGFLEEMGQENVLGTLDEALKLASSIM